MGRDRVLQWIREKRLDWKIHVFKDKVKTVKQAAKLLNTTPDNIAKTLILIGRGKTIAVILRGDTKLSLDKLSRTLEIDEGEIRIAKPSEVEENTGYKVGGVPPAPLPPNIRIIIDKRVLDKEKIYAGGGDQYTLLELNPKELTQLPNTTIADVSIKEPE